jgi:tetratricopeptide (TPR) repeat protein
MSWVHRGNARVDIRDLSNAILDYNQAILIDPKLGEAYYARGFSKILIGQNQSGCTDLKKAKELGQVEAQMLMKEFCRDIK